MNERRPTDFELAVALRAHLPVRAPADLWDAVATTVAETRQQRAWPSIVGALTDADPMVRRRSTLLVAAALLAVAFLGLVAAGALHLWQPAPFPGAHGLFAFVRQGDLYVASADGRDVVRVAHVDGSDLTTPRWSADRRWLAVQTPEPAILGLDLRSGELRRLAAGTISAWSPVDATLAYYTPGGDIALLDVERGQERVLGQEHADPDQGYPTYGGVLVWSPDGRQLAMTDAIDGALVRVDAATGARTTVVASTTCCAFRPTWSPDAGRIAYSVWSERSVPAGFWVAGADGTGIIEVRDAEGPASDPVWSPDGAWIAYRANHWEGEVRTDRLMIVRPDGRDRRRLVDRFGDIVAWSSDGLGIAYTVRDNEGDAERREVHVIRLADGSDRVLPLPRDATDLAWGLPAQNTPAIGLDLPLPSLTVPVTSDEPPVQPASGQPARGDASWGALAFRVQQGESDCYVGIQRFGGALTIVPPPDGPPPRNPPEAAPPEPGASAAPQPAGESCDFTFAPDGSAFSVTSQAHQSFSIVGNDGVVLSGPFPWHDVPTWSPAGSWVSTSGCDAAGACSASGSMIMRPDGSDRHELPGRPVWSGDEQTLAVLDRDGQLLVGGGDGSGLRPIGVFPLPAAWAPDGSEFVFVRDGDAWIARADGSQVHNLTGFDLGGVTGAWWSPDGRWIAVLQGTTMWAFSPDGSVQQRLGSHLGHPAGGWGPEWAPVWSPDSAWLAIEHDDPNAGVGGTQADVTLVHAGDWRAVRLANAWQPAWSLDGRHLAVVSSSGGGYVADVTDASGSGRTTVFAGLPYPPLGWVD
jgi:Tol biopolymer transport system component